MLRYVDILSCLSDFIFTRILPPYANSFFSELISEGLLKKTLFEHTRLELFLDILTLNVDPLPQRTLLVLIEVFHFFRLFVRWKLFGQLD